VVEISVSLSAVASALQDAGFAPTVREAPRRWATDGHEAAVWAPMPGDDAYAIVVVTPIVLDD
jgi:hypothetical protein